MFAVEFRSLSKRCGKADKALTDVNFGVEAGSFFGILAPKDAGKTSLLRLIFNYIRPDSGSISVFERDSVRNSTAIRRYAGFVPAQVNGRSRMRVRAILEQLHTAFGSMDEGRMRELCEQFRLNPHARFNTLTACERKCLAIVSVLLNDPPLIVLDEPSLDLDQKLRAEVFAELHKLHENGSTILFSTISVEEIALHTTHAAVLQDGILLDTAPTADFTALRAQRVMLESPDASEIINALGVEHFHGNDRAAMFLYTNSMDLLIKTLASYTVTSLRIEQPTMESVLRAVCLLKTGVYLENSTENPAVRKNSDLFEDDLESETIGGFSDEQAEKSKTDETVASEQEYSFSEPAEEAAEEPEKAETIADSEIESDTEDEVPAENAEAVGKEKTEDEI